MPGELKVLFMFTQGNLASWVTIKQEMIHKKCNPIYFRYRVYIKIIQFPLKKFWSNSRIILLYSSIRKVVKYVMIIFSSYCHEISLQ